MDNSNQALVLAETEYHLQYASLLRDLNRKQVTMEEEKDLRPRCYYFQTTGCDNPDCFFVHDNLEVARPPVCHFHEKGGRCRNADRCKFFHDNGDGQDTRGDRAPYLKKKPKWRPDPKPNKKEASFRVEIENQYAMLEEED